MAVLHVVCIDSTRKLWHTIRDPKGNWLPFGDVGAAVLGQNPGSIDPGAFDDLDCAGLVSDLHLCLLAGTDVIHTVRRVDGSWFPFDDVLAAAQAPSGSVISIAIAQANGQLDFCAAIQASSPQQVSTGHSLFHATRRSSGTWRHFQDCGGSFNDVACAEAGSSLHFCGITFDHQGVRLNALEHAVRPAGAATTFTPFGDVRNAVLAQNPGSVDPGVFHRVSCAGLAGELHVCVISSGRLFHTIRRAEGSWLPFIDVVGVVVAQNRVSPQPQGLRSIACATVNGELQVICVDSAGAPWLTIRRRNTSWLPFGNVMAAVLGNNPGCSLPGSIDALAMADSF